MRIQVALELKFIHDFLEVLNLLLGVVAAAHVLLASKRRTVLKPNATVFAEKIRHIF